MPGLTGEKMPAASDDTSTRSNTTTAAKAKAQSRAHDVLAYAQRQIDRVVSPSTRQKAIESTTAFASKRPLLSLFIAAQLTTALLPILLFATFVLTTTALTFAFAVSFALFWTGVALLVLVPTLFLTFGLALLVWLWALGAYVVFRAVYARLPARLRRGTRGTRTTPNTNGTDTDTDRRVIFFSKNALSSSSYDLDDAVNTEVREARE
ncbi:hypothetical protein FHL15_005909 [Xylaria flabelliformis]|uniref:Uncharacterized protein n=1 Tax=Xylaria flabelliformis TaxID=2512241 RepID=A0A553HZE9_9PEZI|nr:hypothetical protein FHL15_005909 [Xylaria flabelliformis]